VSCGASRLVQPCAWVGLCEWPAGCTVCQSAQSQLAATSHSRFEWHMLPTKFGILGRVHGQRESLKRLCLNQRITNTHGAMTSLPPDLTPVC
jgi:hypothetical protein